MSIFFGIALTLVMFGLAILLNKKFSNSMTTPLLTGTIFVIIFLLSMGIDYSNYNNGAKYLTHFLIPVTVCFAVPMYKQIHLLKKYAFPILLAMLTGVICSILSVILICAIFGLGDIFAKSLVSISVTTAIAIGITEKLGGIIALTVSSVIITGVLGASISDKICKLLKLKNPIARGLAIGNASHAAGTIKALEMGPVEGAMSSLAIVISGLITAVIAPIFIYLLF